MALNLATIKSLPTQIGRAKACITKPVASADLLALIKTIESDTKPVAGANLLALIKTLA